MIINQMRVEEKSTKIPEIVCSMGELSVSKTHIIGYETEDISYSSIRLVHGELKLYISLKYDYFKRMIDEDIIDYIIDDIFNYGLNIAGFGGLIFDVDYGVNNSPNKNSDNMINMLISKILKELSFDESCCLDFIDLTEVKGCVLQLDKFPESKGYGVHLDAMDDISVICGEYKGVSIEIYTRNVNQEKKFLCVVNSNALIIERPGYSELCIRNFKKNAIVSFMENHFKSLNFVCEKLEKLASKYPIASNYRIHFDFDNIIKMTLGEDDPYKSIVLSLMKYIEFSNIIDGLCKDLFFWKLHFAFLDTKFEVNDIVNTQLSALKYLFGDFHIDDRFIEKNHSNISSVKISDNKLNNAKLNYVKLVYRLISLQCIYDKLKLVKEFGGYIELEDFGFDLTERGRFVKIRGDSKYYKHWECFHYIVREIELCIGEIKTNAYMICSYYTHDEDIIDVGLVVVNKTADIGVNTDDDSHFGGLVRIGSRRFVESNGINTSDMVLVGDIYFGPVSMRVNVDHLGISKKDIHQIDLYPGYFSKIDNIARVLLCSFVKTFRCMSNKPKK
jgi:hypothetical protein